MNGTPALIRGSSSATRRRTPEHQPPCPRHPVAHRRGSCRPCSLGASAQRRGLWRPAGLMARATWRFLVLLGPFCLQLCFAQRSVTHVPTVLLPEGHVAGLPRRLFSRSCSQHPLVVLVPPPENPTPCLLDGGMVEGIFCTTALWRMPAASDAPRPGSRLA